MSHPLNHPLNRPRPRPGVSAASRRRRRRQAARPAVRSDQLRLGRVDVPRGIPNRAAVFIFMRKMRGPLILVVATMCFGSIGLCLVPPPDGAPQLTAFQAFYFMTFTATTIGLGEIPYSYSTAQRVWVVFSIYLSVVTWAYAITRFMTLGQDSAFTSSRRAAAFSRAVSHLREPFVLVLGYGYTGRSVVKALDSRGRRMVVLDQDSNPIERVSTDLLGADTPAYAADAKDPSILGVAGLDHPLCEAVLALTGDDEANLQIVMACRLLRPELPVLARVANRRPGSSMADFNPTAVINPFDDFGRYLLLSLHQPHSYRLITWLMSATGTELPPLPPPFALKRWLVLSDGPFGDEITDDLTAAGHEVTRFSPQKGATADLSLFNALVCGAASDTVNLALAAHARRTRPEVYLVVRTQSHQRLPLLEAFQPDSVFFPSDLVTRQILVHLVNPHYWQFIDNVMTQDDAWARDLTQRLAARLTTKSPQVQLLSLNRHETPAVARWLESDSLTLGDLFRSPQDRGQRVAAVALLLVRGDEQFIMPDESLPLCLDDKIVIAGRQHAFRLQTEVIYSDTTLGQVVTGRQIPTSWVGQWVARQSQRRDQSQRRGEPEPPQSPGLPKAPQTQKPPPGPGPQKAPQTQKPPPPPGPPNPPQTQKPPQSS
ncbi:MAG: potassium channel family protein [Propionibacteriaceae bacterium]|nr:potassium channel family protein [Propionibacteriaceae bacterium]